MEPTSNGTHPSTSNNRPISRVTLFDDPEDDIYDGYLGENDHEDPRIELKITLGVPRPRKPKSQLNSAVKSPLVQRVEAKTGIQHSGT